MGHYGLYVGPYMGHMGRTWRMGLYGLCGDGPTSARMGLVPIGGPKPDQGPGSLSGMGPNLAGDWHPVGDRGPVSGTQGPVWSPDPVEDLHPATKTYGLPGGV